MARPRDLTDSRICCFCRAPLPPDVADCPRCGRDPCDPAPGNGLEGDRVYALLSAANLARMRGNWEEGIDKCVEALRLDPLNPTAHSLVGDIYQDQGRREEAIQWYRMALDLNPDNTADQAKIERLKHPAVVVGPPARPPFWIRVGVPSAIVLAFLMMTFGVWALMTAQQIETPLTTAGHGEPPELRLPPELRPGKGPAAPARAAPPSMGAAGSPSLAVPIETAREAALHRDLQARLGGALQVAGVEIDPSSELGTISVLFGTGVSNLQPAPFVEVARAAAAWAFHDDPSLARCRVRVLRGYRARTAPEIALIADGARDAVLGGAGSASAAPGDGLQLWWSPFFFPTPPAPAPSRDIVEPHSTAPPS